jgi:Fur family transcriptional regulator, ferric uptake regulator
MANYRDSVRRALAEREGFCSAQDLHAEMRTEGSGIGLTTVYRALKALSESGEVDALHTDDEGWTYRACAAREHHHHLVCRQCGRAVEVTAPMVERWVDELATSHEFADPTHTLEIFGICARCVPGNGRRTRRAST